LHGIVAAAYGLTVTFAAAFAISGSSSTMAGWLQNLKNSCKSPETQ